MPAPYPRANAVPAGPSVAVAAIAVDYRDRVVLGRRAKSPGQGAWLLPGGRVEAGETLSSAVVREFQEETGLAVRVTGLPGAAGVSEWTEAGALWVVLYTFARVLGQANPCGGSDVDEVMLVGRGRLQEMVSAGELWYGGSARILKANGWA